MRRKQATGSVAWSSYPPQRQIDPPTLGKPVREKRRCAGIDPIDTVKGQAGEAAEDHHIAGRELQRARGVAAIAPADAEQTTVAERYRDDRSGEVLLIGVLVQAQAGAGGIIVHQAGFRRMRVVGDALPEIEDRDGDRRPW